MLNKLTNRVYYMEHSEETDRPALGLICGDTYSLIVDSGNSPAHAREFLTKVSSMDIPSVKFAAITHWHWDHSFGIEEMGLLTISHRETKKQIEYMKNLNWDDQSLDQRVGSGEMTAFCRDNIKKEMPSRGHLRIKTPDVLFDDSIEIDLGGISCVIQHVGGVHAQDSSIIYIPEEKVLFLGDCLCADFYTGPQSHNKAELLRLLNQIQRFDVQHYVTSHHIPDTYEELWEYLNELKDIAEFVKEDEYSIDDVIQRFQLERMLAPSDDQKIYMQYFISDNEKRKRSEDESISLNTR